MEVYILDDLLRRNQVVDRFESLIWTERHKDIGDFQLSLHTTNKALGLFKAGAQLAINESNRVMTVETVEKKVDADGRSMMALSGRSLEAILQDRVISLGLGGLNMPPWFFNNKPAVIAREIFDAVCVDGHHNVGDKIPFITPGSMYPAPNLLEPTEIIQMEVKVNTVYGLLKELCDAYGFGFRLVRNGDLSQLHFDIYTGNNLTTRQDIYRPVIFSPGLDNLEGITELDSIASTKNAAYVFAKNAAVLVYAPGVDPTVSGFERRVMHVEPDGLDDEPAGAKLTSILTQKGQEALAANRPLKAFDGETPQFGSYKYGVDYQLGDLVEMRSDTGSINFMRVTEQIMVSDSEGDRSYPTLMVDYAVEPDTWRGWDPREDWEDAIPTWADA